MRCKKPKTKYSHDCTGCVFLGTYEHPENHAIPACDLFLCADHRGQGKSIVARYGKQPQNCYWVEAQRLRSVTEIEEGRRLAIERGLLDPNEPLPPPRPAPVQEPAPNEPALHGREVQVSAVPFLSADGVA